MSAGVVVAQADMAKAGVPDAGLLQLLTDLEAKQAEINALETASGTFEWSELDRLAAEFGPIADKIAATSASTSQGIQAKAKALRIVYRDTLGDAEDYLSRHVLGLVCDIVGEG